MSCLKSLREISENRDDDNVVNFTRRAANAEEKRRFKRDDEITGWLTITIDSIHAHLAYGKHVDYTNCDTFNPCDPYLVMSINGAEVLRTPIYYNRVALTDLNLTYKSGKISKDSEIAIKVWDDDSSIFGSSADLMLQTRGDVYVFLYNGLRRDKQIPQNYIETHSTWRDA